MLPSVTDGNAGAICSPGSPDMGSLLGNGYRKRNEFLEILIPKKEFEDHYF